MVHKVKLMGRQGKPIEVPGNWDFPKGGIKSLDKDTRSAVLRELWEETGSRHYEILHEFEEKLIFDFPQSLGIPYTRQETTMFLVRYTGDGTDLCPQDKEIDRLAFFSMDDVLRVIPFEESQAFFRKYLEA